MTLIVVLTEETLGSADVAKIAELHPDASFRVLVPADTERNLLASIVDHLSLGELREALDDVVRREPPTTPQETAAQQLSASLDAFRSSGSQADGAVVDDDPLPALRTAVAELDADEVVVVTTPHALEDTFHTDWASRAREELKVPVMHLYAGTNQLG
ncbi:hypothetical protein OEB99_18565 [Actinotalea sp. M2MS4P-6]|uniref:hypothetical protein n=1 Tax=Actinotalea sp. M2MS4P-6 TaxID=2983762 RepID=UPI0021E47A70|nr:hypothetical protein [Actinotalea sp. M2MS4P-6]MCV2396319.1 hypothetical protein [Actinotalea sp. M2MS4P-6]